MAGEAHRPRRTEIEAVSWLLSRWVWAATVVIFFVVAVLIGVLGAVLFGAPFVETVVRAATQPEAAALTFLAARADALYLAQRRRDYDVAAGELRVTDDVSAGALLTIASFSVLGLVAAGTAFPILYNTETQAFWLLSIAVTVITVPVSYVLLAHYLGELVAADRYHRRYRVSPATWHYLWTAPALVALWMLATGTWTVHVPATDLPATVTGLVGDTVDFGLWDAGYAAVVAPTAVAFCYAARRQVERYARSLLPS